MTDREDLHDLLMAMEVGGNRPETVGDLIDWLVRRRAEAARDQHEASVWLLRLGEWWQLVRRYYGGLGPDALLPVLLERLKDTENRP